MKNQILLVFLFFTSINKSLVQSFTIVSYGSSLRRRKDKETKFHIHSLKNAKVGPSKETGVVVLTDWLDEEDGTENIKASGSGIPATSAIDRFRGPSATPQKFKAMVKELWDQLTSEGQLNYLSEEKRTTIKRALAVIAAFYSLSDHPFYNSKSITNPFEAYQEADVNGDGELTFEEFVRWYGDSMKKGKQSQAQTSALSLLEQGAGLKQIVDESGIGLKKAYLRKGDHSLTKENLREAWLASESPFASTSRGTESIQLSIDIARELIQMQADGDSVVASLLLSVSEVPQFGLSHIGAQFGSNVQTILEDRVLLKSLASPTFASAESMRAINAGKGIKPLLDLDDTPAKLLRDYLVQKSRDPRAFLVQLASLHCELRRPAHPSTVHRRHYVALEALQLYLPVAHAMGLGSKFTDLEEQSYRALFPESYSKLARWHGKVDIQGQILVANAKRVITERLNQHPELQKQIKSIEIQGRTKTMVSVFKKVFRKNKSKNQVLDLVGLRVIITPERSLQKSKAPTRNTELALDAEVTAENISKQKDQAVSQDLTEDLSLPLAMNTLTSYPPPYTHPESKLLHDVYDVIRSIWSERKGRYKNYVDFPKKNGYRSIHTTLLADAGLCFEVQLRSKEMHQHAEKSHQMYKGELHSKEEAMRFQAKLKQSPLLLPSSQDHQVTSKQ